MYFSILHINKITYLFALLIIIYRICKEKILHYFFLPIDYEYIIIL
jgi:hypothetical protein